MTNFRGFAVAAASIGVPAVLFLAIAGPSGALLSQYFGVAALIAMALSQIIATRARFVEPLFGPLDQAYVLHKWLGIIALLAILLHDSIGAEIKSVGAATKLSGLAEGMGDLSLNGLLTLLAISVITIIPYRIWYWTHRAMGACFVLGGSSFCPDPQTIFRFRSFGALRVGVLCDGCGFLYLHPHAKVLAAGVSVYNHLN